MLPGIGPAMTVALLLPVTYSLEPTSALIMFAGVYYGGMYGGSTTSILLNTPGESSSVVTAIEGNLMAKQGRAAQALATAAIGSFVAGTIGTALLVACAPIVTQFAVSMGAPDYFAVMLLALLAVSAVLGSSRLRGFCSLGLGLAIGLIGIDKVSGQQRLTFGQPQLADGIDIVVVAVAIFALGEALWVAAHLRRKAAHDHPGRPAVDGPQGLEALVEAVAARHGVRLPVRGAAGRRRGDPDVPLLHHREAALQAPATSSARAPSRASPGPEAANNASAAGTLVPMLSLGLPTNATAAIMLAALTGFGIQPGPLLFEKEPQLVWGLIASLFIGNALLLLLNLPLAPAWAKLLQIPRPYLYAGILFFASLGAYAVNLQSFDLVLLLVFGLVGFMMRRFGLPILPLIIGVIIGPRIERQLRTALAVAGGDVSTLVERAARGRRSTSSSRCCCCGPLITRLVRRPGRRPSFKDA